MGIVVGETEAWEMEACGALDGGIDKTASDAAGVRETGWANTCRLAWGAAYRVGAMGDGIAVRAAVVLGGIVFVFVVKLFAFRSRER